MIIKKIQDGREIVIDDSERTPVECWSRVMGYHRPVSEWNRGKKQEFADRKFFSESSCDLKPSGC